MQKNSQNKSAGFWTGGFFAGLAFCGTFFCGLVQAEPQIAVQEQYYEVRGATLDAVWKDIRHKAPGGGGVHPGFTNRSVVWSYEVQGAGDQCAPTQLKVTAAIVRYLPRWIDGPSADSETGKEWTRFVKALGVHEDGHVKIGLKVARSVEIAMRQAAAKNQDCSRMKAALEAAAQKVVTEGRLLDAQYDQETQHGKSQGAVLTVRDRIKIGGRTS